MNYTINVQLLVSIYLIFGIYCYPNGQDVSGLISFFNWVTPSRASNVNSCCVKNNSQLSCNLRCRCNNRDCETDCDLKCISNTLVCTCDGQVIDRKCSVCSEGSTGVTSCTFDCSKVQSICECLNFPAVTSTVTTTNVNASILINNTLSILSTSTPHSNTSPINISPTFTTSSSNETSNYSKQISNQSKSLSGLAVGLIIAAALIVAIIITLLVIWKLRYNCRVPAFLSRNDTIRSSTTALTSIDNPKEQDGTVYEQIAEHPYNELEPSEDNGQGYTEISCGPDSNVHSNTDQIDTYLANGRSGQTYSHLHEHSRELTHDYNMSQGTEFSNSGSIVNHTININGSTPNYTLATVINENKEHIDAGSYNKGRLDNEVSLPNITEEDNLESDYDVPNVRKDQEKNSYFELENEPVTSQVTEDSLDTDYDVPPARKADPNMYFELQNTTETDQPTEDNVERDYNDLNDASVNPYFQLENETNEDQLNRMVDSNKSSADGDHHSIGDTEPDGDGSLIGDYDVPPPRRVKP